MGEKRGTKANFLWTKANYEKWKASTPQLPMKPKKISIKDVYVQLENLQGLVRELRSYIDQKFNELHSIIGSQKRDQL